MREEGKKETFEFTCACSYFYAMVPQEIVSLGKEEGKRRRACYPFSFLSFGLATIEARGEGGEKGGERSA